MKPPNIVDLSNELKELINLTSLSLEQKAKIYNWCYQFISTLNTAIIRLEDKSDIHMQRIRKIKKDKQNLNPYIKSLKGSEEFFLSIGDTDSASRAAFDRTILEMFQTNSIEILNMFADVFVLARCSIQYPYTKTKKVIISERTKISHKIRAIFTSCKNS